MTEAWTPLFRANEIFGNEVITHIAEKHGKSASQVILRWHYQLGNVAIPKSASPIRQQENLAIFDFSLPHKDMNALNSLTCEDGRINDLDPAVYEEF